MAFGLGLIALLMGGHPVAARAGGFADWAVIIVAGDYRAHSGAPSEVFDNARRDLAKAFVAAGFDPTNIRQFSSQPKLDPRDGALKADPQAIYDQLSALAGRAKGGCLVYFTSHGSPDGIALGEGVFTPSMMANVVDDACGERPVVAVVSACFSGVFVPALDGVERMVLTAARPDRTSFGCGESDRYTFFDGCVLQQLPRVHDFMALGRAAQACVAAREAKLGGVLPSEPQLVIGGGFRFEAPLYVFASAHDPSAAPEGR
jgi:hypothetical protein